MQVLITGATGFLGRSIVNACIASNIKVNVICRKNSNLSILPKNKNINFYHNNEEEICAAINANGGCNAIIHAATCYGRNQELDSLILDANLMFPIRLIELAMSFGVDTFINIDTSLDPKLNSYSLSKSLFNSWGQLISRNNFFKFINVKLEHLYGPGDDKSRFIGSLIHRFLKNEISIDLTKGEQMRDFIHVDDASSGIVRLLESSQVISTGFSEFQLGSGVAISIKEIVSIMRDMTGSNTELLFGKIPYRDSEIMFSQANIEDLEKIGWRPKISLHEGLLATINSHKLNLE